MSHYDLVDGNIRLTEHDVAEEIYREMNRRGFVTVYGDETDKGVGLEFLDEKERKISVPDTPGLYLIYKKGDFNQYECLYSGEGNIRYRIYRFCKELMEKSRDDESHSAAKKARRYGKIDPKKELYVKYITQSERDSVVVKTLCNHLHLQNIDEHIAHISGAIFNKKVKKA